MNDSQTLVLQTRGDGQARSHILIELQRQLARLSWPADESTRVQLAVEEAISNAYDHGNHQGALGDVELRWAATSAEFRMEVRDQGMGFDPADVPDPTALENLEKLTGRGLLMIKNCMSSIEHREGGRTLILHKILPLPTAS